MGKPEIRKTLLGR